MLLVSVSKASSALILMTLSPVGLVNFSSGQIRRCYTCQRSLCSLMAVCSTPKFTTHVHIICNPKRCESSPPHLNPWLLPWLSLAESLANRDSLIRNEQTGVSAVLKPRWLKLLLCNSELFICGPDK